MLARRGSLPLETNEALQYELDKSSVYKLDSTPGKKILKNDNPEKLFKKLGEGEKKDLLDKLHNMRLKAYAKREDKCDPAKPHLPK